MPMLYTVKEKVEVTTGEVAGFCAVELKPPGPVHNHPVALLELAFKIALPPMHIGLVFVGPVDKGIWLMVTVVVYTVPEPQIGPALLTDNE